MHDHACKVLGVVVNSDQGTHVERAAIFTGASKDVHRCSWSGARADPHADTSLSSRSVNDELSPAHTVSVIEETAQDSKRIDSFRPETASVYHQRLFPMVRWCQLDSGLQGHSNHSVVAAIGMIEYRVEVSMHEMNEHALVFLARFPTG